MTVEQRNAAEFVCILLVFCRKPKIGKMARSFKRLFLGVFCPMVRFRKQCLLTPVDDCQERCYRPSTRHVVVHGLVIAMADV